MTVTSITGDLLVGSRDIANAERPLHGVNPATGATLEPGFSLASPAQVSEAADLAWSAFASYRQTDIESRARFLESIGEEIIALGDTLIDRASAETALPPARIVSERARTVGQLQMFAKMLREGEWRDLRFDPGNPERQPLPKPDLRLRQIPLGPVAVFGASNFPLAFSVAGGDTASALAAGCPVIVKGHPSHPGTSELVGRAIRKAIATAGLHEGVFSLVQGGIETGVALVTHPHIKAVGFTGSRVGGLALVKAAAGRDEPIPVYAEMSSINPVFLFPAALGARTAELAEGFVASLTNGVGQFCTNPGLTFALDTPELDRFLNAVTDALRQKPAEPMLNEGIAGSYRKGTAAIAGERDVTTLVRGADSGTTHNAPALFETSSEVFGSNAALGNEVFGPSSLVVRCKTPEELYARAEALEGQLTVTLQIDPADYDLARPLVEIAERKAGRVLANGWPTGVEVSPAMVHGGPFPATSDSRTTSVGTLAIRRFLRPVSYQDLPTELLPAELRDAN